MDKAFPPPRRPRSYHSQDRLGLVIRAPMDQSVGSLFVHFVPFVVKRRFFSARKAPHRQACLRLRCFPSLTARSSREVTIIAQSEACPAAHDPA